MKLKLLKNTINSIKKSNEKHNLLCKGLDNVLDGYFVYEGNSELITQLLELLEYIFDDKDKWIEHWIYEMEYGTRDLDVILNGEKQDLSNIDKLYNFLMKVYETN